MTGPSGFGTKSFGGVLRDYCSSRLYVNSIHIRNGVDRVSMIDMPEVGA